MISLSKDYLSERTKGIFPSKIREVMDKAKELKGTGINIIDFSIFI